MYNSMPNLTSESPRLQLIASRTGQYVTIVHDLVKTGPEPVVLTAVLSDDGSNTWSCGYWRA